MNLRYFQKLISRAEFDEIKIIGQDIKKENRWYHIIGMTLKDKKAALYVLELSDCSPEEPAFYKEETPRMSLKNNMKNERNQSFFMHISEFQNAGKIYETAGANAGPLKNSDYCEAYLLFMKMSAAGWMVSAESPFYEISWELLTVINIELRDEFEHLPEWTEDMQVLVNSVPESYALEMPVLLECGKRQELKFLLEDKKEAICYINKVCLVDIWEEEKKRFSDAAYKERMLSHMTENEFEQMKEQFFQVLEEHCPKGKCYVGIEYECTEEDIALKFYDKEYLDKKPEPKEGSATALLMRIKPDKEVGVHGLKLRAEVIQKPVERETEAIESELFSYYKMIPKKVERL